MIYITCKGAVVRRRVVSYQLQEVLDSSKVRPEN